MHETRTDTKPDTAADQSAGRGSPATETRAPGTQVPFYWSTVGMPWRAITR